jgi:Ca-activated chloride channel family protein
MALSDSLHSELIRTGTVVLQNPEMLWLLPAMALAVFLCHWLKCQWRGYRLNPPQRFLFVIHPLAPLLPAKPQSARHQLWQAFASWIIFSLLVIALSNPVRIGPQWPEQPPQADIVFIVDTSVSMLLRDYEAEGQRIDRMSMLKAVLQEFASNLSGSRISVIVFGDTVHTLVPFTRDEDLIRRMLMRIETGMAGRYNSVGEAIAYAVNETARQSRHRPVLILFTDLDESIGPVPIDSAAALAAQRKLPLYTVAIGSTRGDGLPKTQAQSSGLIYGPVNLTALKRVAEQTGARAYHAGDLGSLKHAVNDIAQREKRTDTSPPRYYLQPLYPVALLSILVVLTVLQWIGVFRGRRN